jgi:hypothetical protein
VRRKLQRSRRSYLIEVVVVLVFLVLLIVVILPWAGQSLAEGFRGIIEATPKP